MNDTQRLESRCFAYFYAHSQLLKLKNKMFPSGQRVMVDCERYRGEGTVVMEDGTPPENLAVKLENGNVWYYPVHHCKPIT